MVDEVAFENGRISNFEGLVTLTLDRVILHTVVHHSSTSTYMPNFCRKVDLKTGKAAALQLTGPSNLVPTLTCPLTVLSHLHLFILCCDAVMGQQEQHPTCKSFTLTDTCSIPTS